jgi:type IV secretion system protein VirB10
MTTHQDDLQNNPQAESDGLVIRPPRSAVSGIRKQYVRLALILLVLVVALALIIGLGIDFRPRTNVERELDVTPPSGAPAELAGLPRSYADLPQPKPSPPPAEAERGAEAGEPPLDALRQQNEELRRNLASMMAAIEGIDAENKKLLDQIARYESEATKEQLAAWQSTLFFKLDHTDRRNEPGVSPRQAAVPVYDPYAPIVPPIASAASLTHNADADGIPQPTDQERKLAFLNEAALSGGGAHLDQPYLHPRSPYEVQAGTVIPAALLTGINTDLPGDVLAVVTEPVYDSRTGQHLLIPQGAKLYGAYDSEIANGQNRALLVWHRLLMPNGRSIQLDRMRGTDAAGYAGVADRVDYHADKLALGVTLSSVIAYAGNLARGDSSGSDDTSGVDVIGDTVAQEASRVGSKIIDRQLDVQPTITIRPGWPLRVLVNQDVLLAPYTE